MPPLILDGTNGISGVDGTASNPSYEGTDSNTGVFFPAADTIAFAEGGTEVARFDSSGNFGIGTSSPSNKLDVAGVVRVSANSGSISHIFNFNENGGEISLYNNTGAPGTLIDLSNGNTRALHVLSTGDLQVGLGAANTTGVIQFMRAGFAEAMRIDASGNVGIGTSSPATYAGKLTVLEGYITAAHSTSASYINWYSGGAALNQKYWRIGTSSGALLFETVNDAYTTPTERARFTSAGGFTCAGIYNTTVGATNRDVFVDNGGVVGYVSSLRASKTNIQDLTDTSWLHQLNPVTFNYRKKDEEGNYTDETDGDIQYGMIAEDVEQVRPDLCFYDEVDGEQELRGIQYSKLVPVMLKEIQKLRAEIDALKGNA